MATLGAAAGTLTRCGASCRGLYIPVASSPPRRSFRVFAEAQRSSKGRTTTTKKKNAVDVHAASPNSALDDAEAAGNSLRSGEEEPQVVEEGDKAPRIPLQQQFLLQRLKLDKALEELVGFMAPREKGDMRDVILMSLSFAVLVYISQRLVCLYCVVRHMAPHTF